MAKFFDFSHLRGDIFGGLTAGVVALPLALAFGEASGAGPIAGVYGAIIVGFFAALFGGTPSQISGPTGPMIVVFAGVFASLSGDVSLVFATVVLAGGHSDCIWFTGIWSVHQTSALPGRIWLHEWYWLHHHCTATREAVWP